MLHITKVYYAHQLPTIIFHIAGNVTNVSNMINPIVRRDMCHKNLLKFVNEMKELNCQCVIDENYPQYSSSKFYEIVSSKYNVCFPNSVNVHTRDYVIRFAEEAWCNIFIRIYAKLDIDD